LAGLIYSGLALADLDPLTDFLIESAPPAALATIGLISEAIQILANHPLMGQWVEDDMRELVISRGHSGYVALYSYVEANDVVLILAVRHQREVGY